MWAFALLDQARQMVCQLDKYVAGKENNQSDKIISDTAAAIICRKLNHTLLMGERKNFSAADIEKELEEVKFIIKTAKEILGIVDKTSVNGEKQPTGFVAEN